MKHDPIALFCDLWKLATQNTPLKQKNAVCISTINSDGFPEGRFVDLKEVNHNGFMFCSYFDSDKGKQISANPKVAMTVWWDHIGYQARIVGQAKKAAKTSSENYWNKRSKNAQIATVSFNQSRAIDSEGKMQQQFESAQQALSDKTLAMPENWGAYLISPLSIEIFTFKEDRKHVRELYQLNKSKWSLTLLQP